VAIRVRSDTVAQTTKVTLDIHILPFARRHYDMLARTLGGKSPRALRPLPNEIAHIEGNLSFWPRPAQAWAMLGLSDFTPRLELKDGVLKALDNPNTLPLHAAAGDWLAREVLTVFGKDLPAVPEKDASFLLNIGGPGGIPQTWWARISGEVLLATPTKERVEQLAPALTWEEGKEPAQVHLWIGNLSQSRARALVDAFGYAWARRVSLGNVDFLHVLDQQFKVEPRQCPEAAQEILCARPVCPGGGAYRLRAEPAACATAYEATVFSGRPDSAILAEWRFALLEWIERLSIDFSFDTNAINSHVELHLIERPGKASGRGQP
jgi:hypothetical protein